MNTLIAVCSLFVGLLWQDWSCRESITVVVCNRTIRFQVWRAWKISMSVKGSPVSQGSSASIILARMAVAHAPKACWEMEQRVQVSVGIQYHVVTSIILGWYLYVKYYVRVPLSKALSDLTYYVLVKCISLVMILPNLVFSHETWQAKIMNNVLSSHHCSNLM